MSEQRGKLAAEKSSLRERTALFEAVRLLKRARNLWVEDNSITAQEIDLFLGRVGSNTSQVCDSPRARPTT